MPFFFYGVRHATLMLSFRPLTPMLYLFICHYLLSCHDAMVCCYFALFTCFLHYFAFMMFHYRRSSFHLCLFPPFTVEALSFSPMILFSFAYFTP